jgi:hypothetical protein
MPDMVSTVSTGPGVDGFDPLGSDVTSVSSLLSTVFEDARKRDVQNILKCYTGTFDVFSEMLQNALDAVQMRQKVQSGPYKPHIWVDIDLPDRLIRITDNGIGMNQEEFKYCFRPSVSFKKNGDLRGHKGVGATFLAYGFSFLKMQTKKNGVEIAAVFRSGRQWTQDSSGTVPRPKLEQVSFNVPELATEDSGTSVQVTLGKENGERPRDLGWLGAKTAQQWYDVLRIKTPLGGIYLSSAEFYPTVTITVRTPEKTEQTFERAEYYYPHDIPDLKTASVSDLKKAIDSIQGDPDTKMTKLSSDFKRLQCIYEVWDCADILAEGSDFLHPEITEEQKELIDRHKVIMYGCFLNSAKLWTEFSETVLGLRKGQKIVQGGLQMACDFMPQGDLAVIPLTSAAGYAANAHIIVHFTDGNPDLGRKVFQPELTALAEKLAVRAVSVFRRYLRHLRPDSGAESITADKKIHEWKKSQEEYRVQNPLAFVHSGHALALVSRPRQEQDVIALFHELIGMGILKGYRFFGTSQSDMYDSVFFMEYSESDPVAFHQKNRKLGISNDFVLPVLTEPKILEYKFEFESLVRDIEKDEKFLKHINLVVCWSVSGDYKERFYLQSLLVGDEGSVRTIYGTTHRVFSHGSNQPEFELIVLEDLMNWLRSPSDEEARQKHRYTDA